MRFLAIEIYFFEVLHLMYPLQFMYHGTLIGANVLFCWRGSETAFESVVEQKRRKSPFEWSEWASKLAFGGSWKCRNDAKY